MIVDRNTSFLDFEPYYSVVFWFNGCNLKCNYCYNWDSLVNLKEDKTEDAFKFLERSLSYIDGVVLSGGEALVSSRFDEVFNRLCSYGLPIKLFTNGLRPDLLERYIGELSSVSLDLKGWDNLSLITGQDYRTALLKSLFLCREHLNSYEIRTVDLTTKYDFDFSKDLASISSVLTKEEKEKWIQSPLYLMDSNNIAA